MKKFTAFLLCSLLTLSMFSQDMGLVFQTKSATWFGLDYSEAYFVGTDGFTNPADIKDRFFNSWNMLVKNEYSKYDVGKYFRKENVGFSLENVTARNAEVDINERITNDESKSQHLDKDKVQEIINAYNFDAGQSGLGIVFIVECYSKTAVTGYYYVTLFDIESKQVLITERLKGQAGGFGIRNYWARSYYDVMKFINKTQYKYWVKKYDK